MEIRGVKKEVDLAYPKLEDVDNKKLKTCIPKSWLKFGITSAIFGFVMRNKVFATTAKDSGLSWNEIFDKGHFEIAGGVAAPLEYSNPMYHYAKSGCTIITVLSVIAILISLINILHIKRKAKMENKNVNIPKKIKVVLIVFTILLAFSVIGKIIINFL